MGRTEWNADPRVELVGAIIPLLLRVTDEVYSPLHSSHRLSTKYYVADNSSEGVKGNCQPASPR